MSLLTTSVEIQNNLPNVHKGAVQRHKRVSASAEELKVSTVGFLFPVNNLEQ